MYIFYPVGGLANRMRVIDSAVHYASMNNQSCRIYWLKDDGLNCSFASIWKPVDQVIDSNSVILPLFFKLRRKSGFIRWLLGVLEKWNYLKVFSEDEFKLLMQATYMGNLNVYKHCIICSYSTFFPSPTFQSDLFMLQDEVESEIEKETSGFSQYTTGVHIRRTDNIDSIQGSPLELFIDRMNREIASQAETNFYVASDNIDVKAELKQLFKEKVLLPEGVLNRNSKDGIIQAVIEMYALSRCSHILGSFYSSYSEMAATIGKIELNVVKK